MAQRGDMVRVSYRNKNQIFVGQYCMLCNGIDLLWRLSVKFSQILWSDGSFMASAEICSVLFVLREQRLQSVMVSIGTFLPFCFLLALHGVGHRLDAQ